MRKGRNYLRLTSVRVAVALLISLVVGGFALTTAASASPGRQASDHGRHARLVGGVVTAVNGTSFTVKQRDGSTQDIATNADTQYTESGNPAAVSGVAVGDKVLVRLTDATAPTADKVAILLASLGGKVVSTSASAITVTDGQGFTRTVNVSGDTKYFRDKAATTLADVKAGDVVRAYGAANGDALDALFVHVHTPGTPPTPRDDRHHVTRGTVTAVGANTFTIKKADGTTQDIATTADTKYAEAGTRTAPAGVAVGDKVLVQLTDATTPTAARVFIVLVQLRGTVASVSGSDITLTDDGGFTRTVHTNGSTVFTKDGNPIALSDIAAGQRISAYGHVNGSALDALFVNVHDPRPKPAPASSTSVQGARTQNSQSDDATSATAAADPASGPSNRSINQHADDQGQHEGNRPGSSDSQQRVMGIVKSITGNTIVVTTPDGQTTKTVNVTADTTYKTANNQSATLSDIKVGDELMAAGALASDGSLTAAQVFFRTPGTDDHRPPSGGDPRSGGFNGGSGGGTSGPGGGPGGFSGSDGGRGGRR
ncbi:MAG: hypothetical protein JOZ37_03185 [Actinobacteria bacterium]|nr:hypothetical protein [Actinomycetota bacterium]